MSQFTDTRKFKIQRLYFNKQHIKRTLYRNLTEEEAQTHCSDPGISSSTCTTAAAKRITKRNGPWFDSYTFDN